MLQKIEKKTRRLTALPLLRNDFYTAATPKVLGEKLAKRDLRNGALSNEFHRFEPICPTSTFTEPITNYTCFIIFLFLKKDARLGNAMKCTHTRRKEVYTSSYLAVKAQVKRVWKT
jgi:hypothetical protein